MSTFVYPLLFSAGVLAGMWVCERASADPRLARHTYLWGVVGGVIGARLWYAAQYGNPLTARGFSFFGFGIGAALTVAAYHRFSHGCWQTTDFPDAVAPALALGAAIHRIGCFFTGCCFGKVCELPWAVQYPPGTPPYQKHLAAGMISTTDLSSLPIHPTQLYGSLAGIAAFAILTWLSRSASTRLLRHELFLGLLIYYCLYRFLMEFLRDDAGGRHFGPWTFSQVTAAGVFVLAVFFVLGGRLHWWRRLSAGKPNKTAVGCLILSALISSVQGQSSHGIEVIAHRGLTSKAPENTLPAIRLALELGCDGVEVDVRLTRDQRPVLLHDPTVNRTTNGRGRLSQLTFSEVRQFDAGVKFSSRYRGTPIPSLDEAVRLVRGRAKLYLDLKTRNPRPIVTVVKEAEFSPSTYYRAYTFGDVGKLKRLDPDAQIILDLDRFLGVQGVLEEVIARYPALILSSKPTNWTPQALARARSGGVRIFLTLLGSSLTAEGLEKALQMRPAAIVTDQPERVLEKLRPRVPYRDSSSDQAYEIFRADRARGFRHGLTIGADRQDSWPFCTL